MWNFRRAPEEDAAPRLDWSRIVLPVITLAAAGASVAMFIQLLFIRFWTRRDMLLYNALGKAPRTRLILSLAAGALVALLISVPLLWRRPRDAARIERAAALLGPLVLMCLLVPLMTVGFAKDSQLVYLLILSLVVFAGEPLVRQSLAAGAWFRARLFLPRDPTRVRWYERPIVPLLLVVAAALGYSLFNSYFTLMNHRRLSTTAFDLGIYNNLMFNAMHGHPFTAPVLFGPAGGNNLASHAEFSVVLFVPLYALRPGPETMLVLQSFLLGMAAIPLYLFGKTLLPRGIAAVVAVGYLLFAPLHGPNYYDFHWLTISIFFQFWLYYAIARQKKWLTVIVVLILFSIREDIAIGTTVLGAFLLFTRVRPRLGAILMVVSVVWFALDRFVIMQLAGSWWFQNIYNDLFADGESTYGSVLKTLISNPVYVLSTIIKQEKLQYALHMLAPVAFLPVRRPAIAMLIIPGAFFTLLTSNYPPVLSLAFQYTAHWIPYLFLGTVLGLVVIERAKGPRGQTAAAAVFAVALFCHSYCFGAILQQERFQGGFSTISFRMTPEEKQRYADLSALIAMIPREASVAATENEVPHISTRKIAYTMRQNPGPVDYLLVNRSHLGGTEQHLRSAFAGATYGLVAEKRSELYLFKKGPKTPGTDAAISSLGVTP